MFFFVGFVGFFFIFEFSVFGYDSGGIIIRKGRGVF